jgi:hypothetical protein
MDQAQEIAALVLIVNGTAEHGDQLHELRRVAMARLIRINAELVRVRKASQSSAA